MKIGKFLDTPQQCLLPIMVYIVFQSYFIKNYSGASFQLSQRNPSSLRLNKGHKMCGIVF